MYSHGVLFGGYRSCCLGFNLNEKIDVDAVNQVLRALCVLARVSRPSASEALNGGTMNTSRIPRGSIYFLTRIVVVIFLTSLALEPIGCIASAGRGPTEVALRGELKEEMEHRQRAERENSQWRSYTFLACGIGVSLFVFGLIVGAGMGSAARKNAEVMQARKGDLADEQ